MALSTQCRGVSQREQVDARLHVELWVRGQQRRGLDQPVGAVAGLEAHVVPYGHVVQAGVRDVRRQSTEAPSVALDVLLAEDDAYPDDHT